MIDTGRIRKRLRDYLQETGQLHAPVAIVPDDLYEEAEAAMEEMNHLLGYGRELAKGKTELLFRDTTLLTRSMALQWLAEHKRVRQALKH